MNRHKFLDLNGAKVRYTEYGEGPPVVLLHGFCACGDLFSDVAPTIARDFRVICPDLPGHGGSEMLPGGDMIEQSADWLYGICNELQLNDIILIGHSLGGYISLSFADKFPTRLSGLGLFHSTAYPDKPATVVKRNKNMRFVERYGVESFLRSFVPSLFRELNPEWIEQVYQLGKFTMKRAVMDYIESMRDRSDKSTVLSNLDIPVLFILGGHDEFVPIEDVRDQVLLTEKGTICFIEHAAHAGMIEDPAMSSYAILGFSRECTQEISN